MTDRTVTVTLKADVKQYMRSMRRARHATLWLRITMELPMFILGAILGIAVTASTVLAVTAH